jgi:hypothetical protein
MRVIRTILAAITTLVSLLCVAPVLVLVLPFWAIAHLTRTIAPLFERPYISLQNLIEYDPQIGWKPKANLDAYYLAHRDDMLTPYHTITDAQGWPGTTSLAASQIVVFGDSFAFGYGVDIDVSYAVLHPRIRIKAVAAPGYNMVQELLLMRQLSLQLRDKLVVWFIYLENDLFDNLMPNLHHYRTPFVCSNGGRDNWQIVTHHICPAVWHYASPLRPYYPFLAQICTPNTLSQRVYSACNFLIRTGNEVCQQAGARLAVMTIPNVKQLSPEGVAFLAAQGVDGQLFDPDFPDQQIREICQQWGVLFLAAKQHMQAQDYKQYDVHWNERGHQRIGQILAGLYQSYLAGDEEIVAHVR